MEDENIKKDPELEIILNTFKPFIKDTLAEIQNSHNLSDDVVGNIISQTVLGSIQSSVSYIEVKKRVTLIEKQKDDLQASIDLKTEQKIYKQAERLRNLGVSLFNNALRLDTSGKSVAEQNIALLKNQTLKVLADKTSTENKDKLLKDQVLHNVAIQNMKSQSDFINAVTLNGLVPNQEMYTNFFLNSKALLYYQGATIGTDGKVKIKVNDSDVELGTFKVDAQAVKQ